MTDTANAQTDVALDGQPFGTGFSQLLGVVPAGIESLAVHQGRTRQVWEVRITRPDDGKLVARGQLRLQHITVRD